MSWDPTPRQVDVNTLFGEYEPTRERGAKQAATEFLRTLLAGGPVESEKIFEEAETEGISRRTLWRAKNDLGVKADKVSFGGGWAWTLPPSLVKSAKSAKLLGGGGLAPFAERQQLSGLKDWGSPKSAKSAPPEEVGTLREGADRLEQVEVES